MKKGETMVDFINVIVERQTSNNRKSDIIIYPDFLMIGVKDIICKGGRMEAFWYNDTWNTDRDLLFTIIDKMLHEEKEKISHRNPEAIISVRSMRSMSSNSVKKFSEYEKLKSQDDIMFNTHILFSDDPVRREDYSTTKLSYTPTEGPTEAFDTLYSILYDPEELTKILWFIGATLNNEMVGIQKFLYLYGSKGTGKGTVIKLIELLFEGYYDSIDLETLTSGSDFATSQIKEVPVLLDSDADIHKIRNDTVLLKMTAHEPVTVNRKYREQYESIFTGLLVAASNQPYKVRNIDSGIMRRAVVARPTGKKVDNIIYRKLMTQLKFELPGIAHKAIEVFLDKGPGYYEDYVDEEMIEETNIVHSFVMENYQLFGEPATLKIISELYKLYLEDLGLDITGYKQKIKIEMMRYYHNFEKQKKINGVMYKNVYEDFKYKFVDQDIVNVDVSRIDLKLQDSILDDICRDYPAQYSTEAGTPMYKWDNCPTTLKEIDTRELHYVRVPQNHIVIDLDLKDSNGEKDLKRNIEYAEKFPPTYTELSKSGKGIHLHYYYDGDVSTLAALYDEDVEIKIFSGKQALRRKLTLCNNLEISTITSGLPEKEKKGSGMVYRDVEIISWNEGKMRNTIKRALRKEYHSSTASNMSLIVKIFEEAKNSGVKYDLRDLRQDIKVFALHSTNQAEKCLKMADSITYTNMDNEETSAELQKSKMIVDTEDIYFYDIEVYPNLFIVCYKKYKDDEVKALVNPTQNQVEEVLKLPLIGYNNRRYDNHIMYSALLGSTNYELYQQSQRIIGKKGKSGFYGGAYELSYADIYEYIVDKKSLKKWEVELGIPHVEMEIPWDKPVSDDMVDTIVEYCKNDVRATESVFEATYSDYLARLILSNLSGLSVNATTQQHAAAFLFGNDKRPQDKFVYKDLSEDFEGYEYSFGKSTYKGIKPSEGGYVYSEPGVYTNVGLFDVESMHPRSLINLNYFGPYTKRFEELVDMRLDIKHGDYESAKKRFDGKLAHFLEDKSTTKTLSLALKIIINIVYGMTSAKFENKFKHKDNVDNIVAKRGALFMIDLQLAVQAKGYTVVHIKTDSIKVLNPDDEIINFIMEFGKKYGYTFDHEATYDKFALVDKANYICHDENGWSSTGIKFSEPFVFKKLFSKEEVVTEDFGQIKEVKDAAIYLGDKHIGRLVNVYCSITGEELKRVTDDKESALSGTKGYKWRLMEDFKGREDIDMTYYNKMLDDAILEIEKVGDKSLIIE